MTVFDVIAAIIITGFATTIGNAKDFSEIDLAKINRMYRCPEAYITSLQPKAQVLFRWK